MKQTVLYAEIALAFCAGFIGSEAFAQPWWSSPVLKYSEDTDSPAASDAHYMNKDESDQYLLIGLTANANNRPVHLYSIPSLTSATSSNDVAPLIVGTSANLYNVWKGGAVSDDLKLALTGQASVGPHNSLSLSGPWVKGVNVFAITNEPTAFSMDGIDFSHTSEYLFSNIYTAGYQNRVATWNVVDLLHGGIGLTTNTLFTTSIARIRNVSSYYIGGKDLVYYGEGAASSAAACNVCVYDPSAPEGQQETVLVTGLPVGTIACDIMNVKVSGVGLGQMYLYVQSEKDSLYVYELNAGGKSVGNLVKTFSAAEIKALMGGENYDRIRNFEVTNDGRFAFFVPAPLAGYTAKIRVLWTEPVKLASWWTKPHLQVKEDLGACAPQCLNKDESDQYLFLASGISSSSAGYLYSIPMLSGASSSSDVAPIASGKPSAFQPGTVIYYEDFDGIEAADTAAVTNALKWEICETFTRHSAQYAIHNGKFITDNLDETLHHASTDSYVVVKSSAEMKPFCTNDYSYQYDVTYLQASTNNFRYVSLLCNYTGTNVYNTVDVRIRGEGYNQFRYKIPNEWNLYNTSAWPLNATGTNSMLYLLYGIPYQTPAATANYYNYSNVTLTVRVEMSMSNGPSVYVNNMLVSKTDQYQKYWDVLKDPEYAICFKTSNRVKAEIDNLMIWSGCGVEPVWKRGAVSGRQGRVLTGSSGTANASLPLSDTWAKDTTVFSITNDPAMATAGLDALDFSPSTNALYSYSDYFTRTNNVTSQLGYQHKIYKWDVVDLGQSGRGLASNAVFSTRLTQLRNLDAYAIGGKDLIFYGEGQIGLAGEARVCALDPSTGTETVLISAATNDMPSNIMNVKVSGVGLPQMHLFVQCEDGSLAIYELNADGLSVGDLVKAFTPAEIKAILGAVSFTRMRSFEVTNDGKTAFFTYDGADGLYVVSTLARSVYEQWKADRFGEDAGNELVAGDEADPDHDGTVNALEYAMGLDPWNPDSGGVSFGGVTGGYLALSFRMDKEACDACVLYECEACTDLLLQDWTALGVSELLPRADSNAWWQAVFQHDLPVTSSPQRFMRLKVTLP